MGRAAKRDNRKSDSTLVLNQIGKKYTEDGLDRRSIVSNALGKDGKIRPGLTFHGLRKSLRCRKAADMGFSENDISNG